MKPSKLVKNFGVPQKVVAISEKEGSKLVVIPNITKGYPKLQGKPRFST